MISVPSGGETCFANLVDGRMPGWPTPGMSSKSVVTSHMAEYPPGTYPATRKGSAYQNLREGSHNTRFGNRTRSITTIKSVRKNGIEPTYISIMLTSGGAIPFR